MTTAVSLNEIKQYIYFVRGNQVMLDSDLADLYQVETKYLNRVVHRNSERFPEDFHFQLSQADFDSLRGQFVAINNRRGEHRKYLPYVFTEQGVAILSGILNTQCAVEVNAAIMRAFVQLRRTAGNYGELKEELRQIKRSIYNLAQKQETQTQTFMEAIHSLESLVSSKRMPSPIFLAAPSSAANQKISERYDMIHSTIGKPHSSNLAINLVLKEKSRDQLEKIQMAVAKYYELKLKDLNSTKRTGAVALARQIAMYLVREKTGIGFREIGLHFGGRDHTTVLHACQKIRRAIDKDPHIRLAVGSIQQLLKNAQP